MSRPFDIMDIKGKKVIFLGELSKNHIQLNYLDMLYIPMEREIEEAIPNHAPCRCSFILRTERETEEICRGLRAGSQYQI